MCYRFQYALNCTIHVTNDEPLFLAQDIGAILGITNVSASVSRYPVEDKKYEMIDTPNGNQRALFLNPRGLLRLVFSSKKENARVLREWAYEKMDQARKDNVGNWIMPTCKEFGPTFARLVMTKAKDNHLSLELAQRLLDKVEAGASFKKDYINTSNTLTAVCDLIHDVPEDENKTISIKTLETSLMRSLFE